jgi:hypothetical protein
VVNPVKTLTGTICSEAAHLKQRFTLPIRWLTRDRQSPAWIIFSRTVFNASGPNSPAGVWPYSSFTGRRARRYSRGSLVAVPSGRR